MSKKTLVVLAMVFVLLVANSVRATDIITIDEATEVNSDEVNKAGLEMIFAPRKLKLRNGGSRLGVCLLVGKPCLSDADCPSGCYCKPVPLLNIGYCGFL
ncbi:hypothetical protein Csa_014977 [Cucumis sativus]|uniref:Uncharacterized protein n=1 Tax=Cucumis sativus TaxID=3659 RepID=A0A0A0KY29_CUCSA|nr:hypothetical protein Csa_014977 [Cucumis sativus]